MNRSGLAAAVLACSLATGACAPRNATAPVLPAPAVATDTYRLHPGDEVDLRFFDVPQMNDRVLVRPDGTISLQLVGNLDAAGLTLSQLQDAVMAKYNGVLKRPQLTATLRLAAPQRVFVDGEVLRPGVIQSTERLTAKAAVVSAGGLKTSADGSAVILIRRAYVGAPPQVSVLDLESLEDDGTDPAKDVRLATNDILFVPRSGIGNVNKFVDLYLRKNVPVTFGFNLPGSNRATTTTTTNATQATTATAPGAGSAPASQTTVSTPPPTVSAPAASP